ncbi:MAG: acetylxylan esterase [Myxococcota bacterium]
MRDPTPLRDALAALVGITDRRPDCDPPAVGREARGDGFVRSEVTYRDSDGTPIPAVLVAPIGAGPFPGAVVFHPHDPGRCHLGKSGVEGLAIELARRGIVVLAPDARGYEDRRIGGSGTAPHPSDALQHWNAVAHALVVGDTLARRVIDDGLRAVSMLSDHPAVIRGTVGVLGSGGPLALFVAALDARVRWCVADRGVVSYRQALLRGLPIDPSLLVPGIANVVELDDVIGLLAPRPTLLVSTEGDPSDTARMVKGGWAGLHHLKLRPGAHPGEAIVRWVAERRAG